MLLLVLTHSKSYRVLVRICIIIYQSFKKFDFGQCENDEFQNRSRTSGILLIKHHILPNPLEFELLYTASKLNLRSASLIKI